MTDNRLAMYQAKQNFVDNLVRPCLMNADPDIRNVMYSFCVSTNNADWVRESVAIIYSKGRKDKVINVTGDNLRGILIDIFKQGGLDE